MSGYGLQSGVAWRLQLDPDRIGRGSLNSLEFLLVALVGVWVEHELGSALGEGDSSSATGWLTKSSFVDKCPLNLAISRSLASYLNNNSIPHYSQWFPGKENSVADVLSRDFHLDDSAIVSRLHEKFRLVRLTTAMISGVGELLCLLSKTQPLPRAPVPSAAAVGASTSNSSPPSATTTTPSWSASSEGRSDSKSSPVLR